MSGPTILTFGCRLNIEESEAIRAVAAGRDDLLIVNSCAVTAEAGRQARQAIRRATRETPDRRVIVTGCGAEVERDLYAGMAEIDHLVGNAQKLNPALWRDIGPASPRLAMSDITAEARVSPPPAQRFAERVRGFVQVQNGCDHRCSFCIIPFGRGRSRSLAPDEAVAAVGRLAETGFREVVLTGVDLTSYDGGDAAPTLGALVRTILREVPELPRLRLSSIDAVEIDDLLLQALAEEPRLMPHLHLSLQAGDDLILKRMKRRHSAADAVRLVEAVRRLRPDAVFGADLIAGFPTETQAMAEHSLDLVEACGIVHLHVFPFSPRPGTPAARMPQLPVPVVKERARRLREAGAVLKARALEAEQGQVRMALVEHGGLARTEQFFAVRPSCPLAPGTLLPLAITGRDGDTLSGDPASVVAAAA